MGELNLVRLCGSETYAPVRTALEGFLTIRRPEWLGVGAGNLETLCVCLQVLSLYITLPSGGQIATINGQKEAPTHPILQPSHSLPTHPHVIPP